MLQWDNMGPTSRGFSNPSEVDVRLFGALVLILGVLSLASPAVAGAGVAAAIALFLIVAGIVRTMWAFRAGSFGTGALAVLTGGIMVLGGIAMFARPLMGAASMALVLAIYFLADGVGEIIGAFGVRPAEGWGFMVFNGVVSVLLGWMIFSQWPLSGPWAIGVLVGIRLMLAGLEMLMFGSAVAEATAEAGQ